MRVVYDSTNITDEPLGAQIVGYYIDGIYATTAAVVRIRFPLATLVPISAIGTNAGIAGDVEPGCMTVQQGMAWVQQRRRAGVDPTIYCNELNAWPGIRQAFRSAGIPEPHYWVADYDGVAVVPAGAVAKQYENPTLTGGHFDKSVALDYWPGVDVGAGSAILHRNLRSIKSMGTSDNFIAFGIGDNDALYAIRFTNVWTEISLGGAVSDFDVTGSGQRLDVFARGVADRRAYHIYSNDAGATWSAWQLIDVTGTYKSAFMALGPGPASTALDLSSVTSAIAALDTKVSSIKVKTDADLK